MNLAIAVFFCCLHPRERGVLKSTIEALLVSLWVGFPLVVWEAFWLPYPASGEAVRVAFMEVYGLEIGTIEIDGLPVESIRLRSGWLPYYVVWSLYLLTPESFCLSGCQQSAVP